MTKETVKAGNDQFGGEAGRPCILVESRWMGSQMGPTPVHEHDRGQMVKGRAQ